MYFNYFVYQPGFVMQNAWVLTIRAINCSFTWANMNLFLPISFVRDYVGLWTICALFLRLICTRFFVISLYVFLLFEWKAEKRTYFSGLLCVRKCTCIWSHLSDGWQNWFRWNEFKMLDNGVCWLFACMIALCRSASLISSLTDKLRTNADEI